MESDKSVFYAFKYLPIVAGLFLIAFTLLMHLNPANSTFNGEPGAPDLWSTAIIVLIGILVGLLPLLYTNKLVLMEVGSQTIRITKDDNSVLEFTWMEVDTVNMVPFIFPPLYKLRIKDTDDYYLFNTTRWGAQFLVFTWDWSDMGTLIRKKKEELGI